MRKTDWSQANFLGDTYRCHKIFTITTYPSFCCFTDKCHALNSPVVFQWWGWVEELSYKDRRMDRHGHTHHPQAHPSDLSSPASISETFQGVEQELALPLRNSAENSVCWVTLRH